MSTDDNAYKKRKVVPVDDESDDNSKASAQHCKSFADLETELAETKRLLLETQEKLQQALQDRGSVQADDADDVSDGEDSVQLDVNTKDPWMANYVQLREHYVTHRNCRVKQSDNKKLNKWVQNQRTAYGNVKDGKKGKSISPERIALLDGLGFEWGKRFPTPRSWDDYFAELVKRQKATGNCNVPMHPTNPSDLAKWVSAQRSEYKRFHKGQTSLLSLEQIEQLKNIGFKWNGLRLSKLERK